LSLLLRAGGRPTAQATSIQWSHYGNNEAEV
jgi:hypothetical protein